MKNVVLCVAYYLFAAFLLFMIVLGLQSCGVDSIPLASDTAAASSASDTPRIYVYHVDSFQVQSNLNTEIQGLTVNVGDIVITTFSKLTFVSVSGFVKQGDSIFYEFSHSFMMSGTEGTIVKKLTSYNGTRIQYRVSGSLVKIAVDGNNDFSNNQEQTFNLQ